MDTCPVGRIRRATRFPVLPVNVIRVVAGGCPKRRCGAVS